MFVVVAYDISSDEKRNKCMNILKDYGNRVNFSVFECTVDAQKLKEIKEKINKLIDNKTDSVLYYILCDACKTKRTYSGAPNLSDLSDLDNTIIRL